MTPEQIADMLAYEPTTDALKERVILVTGAGSGLGRAIAQACAAHGATVILLGRTIKKLEMTYDQIMADGGAEPAIFPMNLEGATWENYEELISAIEREFGQLDGLVHNAVLFDSLRPLAETTPPNWMKAMQVNLNAPFFLTQLCLPLLSKPDHASVVFVTDHVGPQGQAFWGAYGVAKAGLSSLASMWAKELKNDSICIHAYDPGPVKTQLRELAFPAEPTDVARAPEDVTRDFLYLLSTESAP